MEEINNMYDNLDESNDLLDNDSLEYIEESSQINYSSFSNASVIPMDASMEMIISWNKSNKLHLNPQFQRREVWENKRISLFIESLILNIPIPSILLAQDTTKNQLIVIDGKQRLNSILSFWAPDKDGKGIKLTGLKVLSELNGYTYKKLKEDPSKIEFLTKFENAILKATILKNYDEKLLFFIFSRLNSGSVPLSTQELRQAMYPGKFVTYANEFSMNSIEIRKVLNLKKPDKRMRDTELVIRYFAFKCFREKYDNSINDFFNYTCEQLNNNWANLSDSIKAEGEKLTKSINFILNHLGIYAFKAYFIKDTDEGRKEFWGPFNRPMFDLMSVIFSEEKYREIITKKEVNLVEHILNLFKNNSKFADAFLPTTHSTEKTNTRFNEFIKSLDLL